MDFWQQSAVSLFSIMTRLQSSRLSQWLIRCWHTRFAEEFDSLSQENEKLRKEMVKRRDEERDKEQKSVAQSRADRH